jgi:hypothetical protein
MTDNVTNSLLLEHLKAIQTKLVSMSSDISDLKVDVGGLKSHMSGFMMTEISQDSAIAALQSRLDRIERRFDINS